MTKKLCLFCNEIVPTEPAGEYETYLGCCCSPGGSYKLLKESYGTIYSLPHAQKREMLHIVSAYIRERSENGSKSKVTIQAGDLERIAKDPGIPVTLDDKGKRLLRYVYSHAGGPGEPVVIHPLSRSYNLTYSPNMQELVFIIDKLQSEELLVREGMTFKLTEKGWSEAAANAAGPQLKPCLVLIPDEGELRDEWSNQLLPRIEQCGYHPQMLAAPGVPAEGNTPAQDRITDSKLILADLTHPSPDLFLTVGYALAMQIPVICTVHSKNAENLAGSLQSLRPIVWNSAEELAHLLQQRL